MFLFGSFILSILTYISKKK
ncbi:MAG: putative holin-like toxin [Firmicutes bacterium]|nr:putative holin-like toxin [Bacillota bacterium]